MDQPKRLEVWLVRLDPGLGSEIKKTRPALIISNDLNNQYASLVTVLPISDKGEKVYPFEIEVSDGRTSGLTKPSKIRCQQIRTIDKERLVKKVGSVDKGMRFKIEEALKLHLGMEFSSFND